MDRADEKGESRACAVCGARSELVADPNLEDLWICRPCLERSQSHQDAIDHGYDDEEPRVE